MGGYSHTVGRQNKWSLRAGNCHLCLLNLCNALEGDVAHVLVVQGLVRVEVGVGRKKFRRRVVLAHEQAHVALVLENVHHQILARVLGGDLHAMVDPCGQTAAARGEGV